MNYTMLEKLGVDDAVAAFMIIGCITTIKQVHTHTHHTTTIICAKIKMKLNKYKIRLIWLNLKYICI